VLQTAHPISALHSNYVPTSFGGLNKDPDALGCRTNHGFGTRLTTTYFPTIKRKETESTPITMPTATCYCGACHINIDSIVGTALCHCMVCRKQSASAFSINAAIPATGFHLERGTPKERPLTHLQEKFQGKPESMPHSWFCVDCGCSLWVDWPLRPELKILKAGILDEVEDLEALKLKLVAEQFTARRPAWLCPIEGAVQIEGQQGEEESHEMAEKLQAKGSVGQ
jgi:hypothetical protein